MGERSRLVRARLPSEPPVRLAAEWRARNTGHHPTAVTPNTTQSLSAAAHHAAHRQHMHTKLQSYRLVAVTFFFVDIEVHGRLNV